MGQMISLEKYLTTALSDSELRRAVAATIGKLAAAAIEISDIISMGPLGGELGAIVGDNSDGDQQKALDVRAHDIIVKALEGGDVALLGSEEADDAIVLDGDAPLVVTTDPLDGSSNISTNVTVGTIFSIYPRRPSMAGDYANELLQKGAAQLAAGFFCYGPSTNLVLTTGNGTQVFTLDRKKAQFVLTTPSMRVPNNPKKEFAINVSNYRYWDAEIRAYVDDCIAGENGPRDENYNMRWVASLVAETYRILTQGGIFLYPADSREKYGKGRLRLVYEANPIAFIVEQAGGRATDAVNRILEIDPKHLHERVPLIFGTNEEVDRVTNLYSSSIDFQEKSPLFSNRGLFRN